MKFLPVMLLVALFPAVMRSAEPPPVATRDPALQEAVDRAVAAPIEEFAAKKLQSNQVALSVIDLRDASRWRFASHRGDAAVYPASVVKLFYLAATHQWMEDGRLRDTDELQRALRDMIVESSNDATHYVLDVLTDTTSGPELPEAEMRIWGEKRNAVNRFFGSLGYTNINCNQKPWCEGPYGRDRIWVGKDYANRNMLTSDATARLLAEIAERRCVSGRRSEAMLALLQRDPANSKDGQARFTFSELPLGGKLFSKAGWTSTTRHDAAFVEGPGGKKFVLVTFTTGQASNRELIPFLARSIRDTL